MNILLTNISVLAPRDRAKTIDYCIRVSGCDVQSIKAIHTNESILKCFAEMQEIKTNGGLNRIIALVSNRAKEPQPSWDDKSAYDYYRDRVKEQYPMITPEIIEIPIENDKDEQLPTSKILSDICKFIDPYDKVYIDSAGGQRTISNLVQLLSKILNYIGVETPCTLYSDINNTPTIVDTADFTRMARLADAFNEFMTSGKSDQLKSCFNNPSQDVETLLDAMCEFSGKVRLGDITGLDNTINKLKTAISDCQQQMDDSIMENVVLKRFLPVIERKLFSNGEGIDYVKIVQWCLDNVLIQQALTVFTEKIPCYLFEQGVFIYKGNVNEAKEKFQKERIPINPAEWETYAFYTTLFETKSDNPNEKLFNQFKDCLLNGTYASNNRIDDAIAVIEKFKRLRFYRRPVSSQTSSPKEVALVDFINKNTFINFEGLCKSLTCNLNPTVKTLLELEDLPELDTLQKKFVAVDLLRKGKTELGDFRIAVDNETMAKAMYAYLYVKAVRNKINHASSEENLDDAQQGVLETFGYNFERYDLDTVKKNIQNALNAIKEAAKQVKDKEKKEKPEKKVIKTELPKIELKILGKIEL